MNRWAPCLCHSIRSEKLFTFIFSVFFLSLFILIYSSKYSFHFFLFILVIYLDFVFSFSPCYLGISRLFTYLYLFHFSLDIFRFTCFHRHHYISFPFKFLFSVLFHLLSVFSHTSLFCNRTFNALNYHTWFYFSLHFYSNFFQIFILPFSLQFFNIFSYEMMAYLNILLHLFFYFWHFYFSSVIETDYFQ